eukprot:TRINITY_DN104319_c0_g1_i1.p1 TRINITY_DN104319_c0_g1~~TRINITY_DN104319_c0_g1_i1.p1  ORF type:complete len:306 (+),score=191.13 TRINITY_DN104319_c0_g1_i1:46-963(+)
MSVLVTGATGHVGSVLVKELCESKEDVKVFAATRDADSPMAKRLKQFGAELVVVDFDEPETLEAALKGVAKLAFISPFVAEHQPITTDWINAINDLKEEKPDDFKLTHIVRLSVVGAGDPVSQVAKWHAMDEVLCTATDVPSTFVRSAPFIQTIGNFDGVIMKATGTHITPLGSDAVVSYVDVRDIVRVFIKELASTDIPDAESGRVYELKGRLTYTQQEIVDIINSAAGTNYKLVSETFEQYKGRLLSYKIPEVLADVMVNAAQNLCKDDSVYATADDSVKQAIGTDAITVEEYVKENTHMFKP